MKKIFRYLLSVVAIGVVLLSFYLLWKQSQPVPQKFHLVQARRMDIFQKVTVSGSLEPRNAVSYVAEVSGKITSLKVEAGDFVHKGDLLAVIEPVTDHIMLTSAQEQLHEAQLQFTQTQRELEHSGRLYEKGALSRTNYNKAKDAHDNAILQVNSAKALMASIRNGYSTASGARNVTEIRSKNDGYVLRLNVAEGDMVKGVAGIAPDTEIVWIGRLDDLLFEGMIDEVEIAKLKVGQKAALTVAAIPDVPLSATVSFLASTPELVNGVKQYKVKATVEVPEGVKIRSGYSAYADVVIAERRNVVGAEEVAVSYEEGKPYVYRLTSDPEDMAQQTFERVEASLGVSDGLVVELKSGIGEKVYLRGLKVVETTLK